MIVACETEGGDDDVRYAIRLVEDLDRSSEGFQVSDGCVGEKSVVHVSIYYLHTYEYDSLSLKLIGKDEISFTK